MITSRLIVLPTALACVLAAAGCPAPVTQPPGGAEAQVKAPATTALKVPAGVVTGILRAPAAVIGQSGSAVIGQSGSAVIGQSGSAVIGQSGSAVIGQSGSALAARSSAGLADRRALLAAPVAEMPVQGAEIFIADRRGEPMAGLPRATTDAAGRYRLPDVPAGYDLIVVARFPGARGAAARFEALVRTGEQEASADLSAASTLVTAGVAEVPGGPQGAVDAAAYAAAVQEVEARLPTLALPDFTDRAAVRAKVNELAATVATLAKGLEAMQTALRRAEDRNDELAARIRALEEKLAARPSAGPTALTVSASPSPASPGPTATPRGSDGAGSPGPSGGPAATASPTSAPATPAGEDPRNAAFAGTGAVGFAGDGGPAALAQFREPWGLAWTAAGDLLVADRLNHRVRRIRPDGTITTVAGTGEKGSDGDGGPATSAKLGAPTGLAVDPAGNLYIADTDNHRIRRVRPDGTIEAYAGTGKEGFGGDGGQARDATFAYPTSLAFSGDVLYVSDTTNGRVRKIAASGAIMTVAGNGGAASAGDGGAATAATLIEPRGLALGAGGELYVVESGLQPGSPQAASRPQAGGRAIRRVGPDGVISTVPVLPSEGGREALQWPFDVVLERSGNLLVADRAAGAVLRLKPTNGKIEIVLGEAMGTPMPAMKGPGGLALDPTGALYVAEIGGQRIRKVSGVAR